MAIGRWARAAAAAGGAWLAAAPGATAQDGGLPEELRKTREQVEALRKRVEELEGKAAKPAAPAGDLEKAVEAYLSKHPAAAGPSNVSAPGVKSLKFSGQVLAWTERWNGSYRPSDPGGTDVQDVAWLRVSLQADAEIDDGLRARVEVRDARAFGQEPSTTIQAQSPGVGLDLKQGWLEADDVLGSGAKVRAGRMVLAYGDQRLVGDYDWNTYGRSFDALLASRVFERTRTKVDVFAARVVERGVGPVVPGVDDDDQDFFGVYTTTPKALHHSDLDVYAFWLRDLKAAPGEVPGSAGNTGFGTAGARVSGVKDRLDWTGEAAVQAGRVNGDRLFAWAAHAGAGWTFLDSKWTPRVGLSVDRATGDDDPADGDQGSFQTLFPTGHGHFGILDLAAWRNLQAVGATLRLKPAAKWTVELGAWRLWVVEETDGWFATSGALIRPGAAGASKDLGTELDAAATWKGSDHLKISVGGAQFIDGGFVRDTGGGGDTFWCYVRVQVDF
jgi:alginate export protein